MGTSTTDDVSASVSVYLSDSEFKLREGCKRQWGVFMCQMRMSEECRYLLDGEAVRECACIVCVSPF